MALKIKAGSVISPYGATGNSFDENSEVTQAMLEHLQTRFPDDIEETEAKEKKKK